MVGPGEGDSRKDLESFPKSPSRQLRNPGDNQAPEVADKGLFRVRFVFATDRVLGRFFVGIFKHDHRGGHEKSWLLDRQPSREPVGQETPRKQRSHPLRFDFHLLGRLDLRLGPTRPQPRQEKRQAPDQFRSPLHGGRLPGGGGGFPRLDRRFRQRRGADQETAGALRPQAHPSGRRPRAGNLTENRGCNWGGRSDSCSS